MQSSPYNNPMLAQGLSGLVESFIGNPSAEAQAQEAASRALLNNQTAQFRDAIGETGLSGDLASMMVRSLQAGPDYSRHAPTIGDATIRMGALGFGGPQHTPSGDMAGMIMSAMQPSRGGRSSGGSGGSTAASFTPKPMTASDVNNMRSLAGSLGLPPEEVFGAVQERLNSGQFRSAGEAIADAMASVGDIPGEPVVEQPGLIGRLLGREPTTTTPTERGIAPLASPTGTPAPEQSADPVAVLNEAREAISRGADPKAVAERLAQMGIDPGDL